MREEKGRRILYVRCTFYKPLYGHWDGYEYYMEHDKPIYCLIDSKLQVLAKCTTKSGASLTVIILAKLPLPFWLCLYKQMLPF